MNSSDTLITFWGTRGSIPTPGRNTEKYGGNTSCVVVEDGDDILIFDAGSGIRPLGQSLAQKILGREGKTKLHLFFSHTHWDHIQGLPFFVPAYLEKTELYIYAEPEKSEMLQKVLSGQMVSSYFPVSMSMFAASIRFEELPSEPFLIGALALDWQRQREHPGGSLRFSVIRGVEGKTKKFVYASDVELDPLVTERATDKSKAERCGEYIDFVRDADLLVADGQYTQEEYGGKVGWGHTSLECLISIAEEADVKRLAVFHHDPERTDREIDALYDVYVPPLKARHAGLEVFWAREGMSLRL